MALEYQNIFTQVQVQGPPEMGMAVEPGWNSDRVGAGAFSRLAGWLGNAHPDYAPEPRHTLAGTQYD